MFIIDPLSRTPVYEQIISQLERFVVQGVLHPGDQVPSVRSLSVQLGINPNTILKAFSELAARGIISAAAGRGYFICPDAQQVLAKLWHERLRELRALCAELAQAGITWEEILQSAGQGYAAGATLLQEEGTK